MEESQESQELQKPQIGIIGAGNIGATLTRLLADAGYSVAISNTRGPESLAELVRGLGPNVHAASVEDAAAFGEIVIEAIPFTRYKDLPAAQLAGKIVVSASNYFAPPDGALDMGGHAQSELVAAHLAGARLVKAFNTIWFQHLQQEGDTSKPLDERRVILLSGDDAAAKQTVAELVRAIGFGPLDLGSLHDSTRQEPGSQFYNNDITLAEARALLA